MNRFALLAASAGTGAALSLAMAVTQPAKAGGHINGYEVSYLYDSGSYGTTDTIHVYGPSGLEKIQVRCAPFDWSSYGANTEAFAASIARAWCF
ncbi:hypothetical protein SynSYN20_01589 [Synechococcus sp. SYN20]|uniref:hypothetical protein n=1 Tax=Synechococcus sp. SYN20 TaxID=1050714 RepID=UPI001647D96C|nr:hypothetical protein [Synechococcus sp. SYN20]QNJ25916.1 hypothetical protein SynSYN20_01589 [Synechococcus sp. SYN20]